eukprot:749706-Hanusia_phi.AAC.3
MTCRRPGCPCNWCGPKSTRDIRSSIAFEGNELIKLLVGIDHPKVVSYIDVLQKNAKVKKASVAM